MNCLTKPIVPEISEPIKSVRELVINWHITEACNYRCEFCYAKWNSLSGRRDLIKNELHSRKLIQKIYDFFRPSNHANPLSQKMSWESVRLNFAGGEPLLYENLLPDLLRYSRKVGFKTSIITNGSRLSKSLLSEMAPNLDWLGLSIDSTVELANQEIGRVDRRDKLLDVNYMVAVLKAACQNNPSMKLKINTVVNAANASEDMSSLIADLSPEKWKILRVLPTVNRNLEVSDHAFSQYVKRHQQFKNIYRVEDNHEMLESYIMIDPNGRFYQNSDSSLKDGYQYSQPILTTGAANAFASMRFLPSRFAARYSEAAQ